MDIGIYLLVSDVNVYVASPAYSGASQLGFLQGDRKPVRYNIGPTGVVVQRQDSLSPRLAAAKQRRSGQDTAFGEPGYIDYRLAGQT